MSKNENNIKGKALLAALATIPMFVFDLVDFEQNGEYHLHPILVEQLLIRRGQFNGCLSVIANLERHYGKEAAQLAEDLV